MKIKTNLIFFLILLFSVALVNNGYGQVIENNQFIGDYKSKSNHRFAQVYISEKGEYKVNIVTNLISRDAPLAILTGENISKKAIDIKGDGWIGKIENGNLKISKDGENLKMNYFERSSPTMNAKPPKEAIVLFDGKNLDAWLKAEPKDWLIGSGPADNWAILPGGILEVSKQPSGLHESILTKQKFGDLKLHLEFRLLGEKTNGGVYFMSRYELNIKDAYPSAGNTPIGFGNISKPKDLYPAANVAFPPLQWQTFDVDFRAPRFDKSGTNKIENAKITVSHNGVTIYENVEIEEVKGATGILGEAGVGPIYLQDHGNVYQFRNIWVIDKTLKGTENHHTPILEAEKAKKKGGNKNKAEGTKNLDAVKKTGGKNKTDGEKNLDAVKKTIAKNKTEGEKKPVVAKKGGSKNKAKDANYEGEKNPFYAAVTVSLLADPSGKPAKPVGFVHPGILVNGDQLNEIKRRVAAGIEPQASAFEVLKNSPFGAKDYVATPRETVSCGPYSNPNLGCKDEQKDCAAAYSQALLWSITGDKIYAENAIKIMNAWSSTLVGGHNYANGPVQAAWTGSVWPRAAEIIRYTYDNWSESDVAKFQNMLRTQYLPSIIHGNCENGNKELAMSEALINIGVFNDDKDVFDLGIKMWRGRTPAYIYLKSDGLNPIEPPGCGTAIWGNKGHIPEFVDGILQETARDARHPGLGFASIANAAETARQQGVNLYEEEGKRMMAAMEFQAQYLPPNNVPVPENLIFTHLKTWEIAFNHFHDRMGYPLPNMSVVIPTNRPTGTDHHMVWETLTHAGIGNVGLPPIKK
ncbi:MAG: DUF1080 domain-containing protein [Flavobacteriaceae bacterium]|nr:DUF1080 domain-containing protein [Flavobacteriaceae bacterium]